MAGVSPPATVADRATGVLVLIVGLVALCVEVIYLGRPVAGSRPLVSDRLRRRIERDFRPSGNANVAIHLVQFASTSERVQAAMVLSASGDLSRLRDTHTSC